jgi:predicted esterase
MLSRFEPGTSPSLLLLHGTGGDENDLIPLGQLLRPGAALLSPRGQILENGQPRFFLRLAPGVFDEDDLIRRTHELADFVEDQSARQHLGQVIAVGYSNGANIAASLLLLRPDLLAGAILFRAMLPLEPPQPPQLDNTPVLLIAGRHDSMIPQESTQRLAVLLEQAGANLTLEWLDTAHGLEQPEFLLARSWLSHHFPGQAESHG